MAMDEKDGLSIRKWIENKWKTHFLDDPDGLIFIELPTEPQDDEIRPYPTYKSIQTIYDYDIEGSAVEYVVFKVSSKDKIEAGLTKEDTVYRIVDDAFDYWVKVKDQTLRFCRTNTG